MKALKIGAAGFCMTEAVPVIQSKALNKRMIEWCICVKSLVYL